MYFVVCHTRRLKKSLTLSGHDKVLLIHLIYSCLEQRPSIEEASPPSSSSSSSSASTTSASSSSSEAANIHDEVAASVEAAPSEAVDVPQDGAIERGDPRDEDVNVVD